LLNGGHKRFAIGDRQAEIFRPLRLLLEHCGLDGVAAAAVIVDDLEQDPDTHGASPPRNAGKRAFHKHRCGKLEASPARWLPAIMARMGTQTL
jgi:hypothetical protein